MHLSQVKKITFKNEGMDLIFTRIVRGVGQFFGNFFLTLRLCVIVFQWARACARILVNIKNRTSSLFSPRLSLHDFNFKELFFAVQEFFFLIAHPPKENIGPSLSNKWVLSW